MMSHGWGHWQQQDASPVSKRCAYVLSRTVTSHGGSCANDDHFLYLAQTGKFLLAKCHREQVRVNQRSETVVILDSSQQLP